MRRTASGRPSSNDGSTIEPMITEVAPEPLFSTDDDLLTASKKLIARKRLDDDAEDDVC
jgi:hypothetical protein